MISVMLVLSSRLANQLDASPQSIVSFPALYLCFRVLDLCRRASLFFVLTQKTLSKTVLALIFSAEYRFLLRVTREESVSLCAQKPTSGEGRAAAHDHDNNEDENVFPLWRVFTVSAFLYCLLCQQHSVTGQSRGRRSEVLSACC